MKVRYIPRNPARMIETRMGFLVCDRQFTAAQLEELRRKWTELNERGCGSPKEEIEIVLDD